MSYSINEKAEELAYGALFPHEGSQRIIDFVRDHIQYSLDEWTVKPIEVLEKGRGICAGKALLAAEMHRPLNIPYRFKIAKVLGEEGLFEFVARHLEEAEDLNISPEDKKNFVHSIYSLPKGRDHIILQVFIDGQWIDFDLARDKGMDYGMRFLGIGKERWILSVESLFDSIDRWLEYRMQHHSVLEKGDLFFRIFKQTLILCCDFALVPILSF